MFKEIETISQARKRNVHDALYEDIGIGSFSEELIDRKIKEAVIFSKDNAILCGIDWCNECFEFADPNVEIEWFKSDGENIVPGEKLCLIKGDITSILKAERSALNFLQLLSYTATVTNTFVKKINSFSKKSQPCLVFDTRKTLPGLRLAQKYAVTVGGGNNQRLGLWDGVLFKENHLNCLDGIGGLIKKLEMLKNTDFKEFLNKKKIQVEVESFHEFELALSTGFKNILLDNFTDEQIRKAVKKNNNRAILEVSGGLDKKNLKFLSNSGVNRISIGRLTKNVEAVDFTLLITNNKESK